MTTLADGATSGQLNVPPGELAMGELQTLPLAAVDMLLAFGEAITRSTRPDDLLARVATTAMELLKLPWSVLLLRDPVTGEMRVVAGYGLDGASVPVIPAPPPDSPVLKTLMRGEPVIIEDYQGGAPLSPDWRELGARLGLRAVVGVPLITGTEFVGSLHLGGPDARHFAPADIAVAQRLARLAAQLLRHTEAHSAAHKRVGAFETMQALASSLVATMDIDTLLQILVERAVEVSGASGGSLLLWDAAENALVLRKSINGHGAAPPRLAAGEGLVGIAFTSGRPQLSNNYQHFAGATPAGSRNGVTNGLAVPLLRHGHPFGVLGVFSKLFQEFTPEDVNLLTLFASQAAVALDNQTLYATVLRQQRHLDTMVRAMHDALVVYDRDGCIVLLNPAAEDLLGLRPAIIGRSLEEVTADEDSYFSYRIEPLFDWPATFGHVIERGVTLAGMVRIHSDPERTFEAFYTPYVDENGAVVGVIAVARDVSATQELERVRAELDVARQHDDFLAIAAHELRTPITGIKGFTDLLGRRLVPGYTVTERDDAMLGSLSAQVNRLASLVSDLLDVGQLQASKIEFRWGRCSVRALLQSALDSVRPVAAERESDLLLAGADAVVCCDQARLEQVFVNLLTNALKYSTSGPITATVAGGPDHVRVEIADQGAGIAADDLPRVFERFYRSHDVYAHQRGLGLGLYISREIVTRHGGRIWVESRQGVGSTFYVEIPLTSAESHCGETD
ncbi:MAG TPA: GAF domain-containing protein [Chloroflexia bacterium]|nr:GAF domain-containing protein [Chloroflexia bacterium]